MGLCHQEKGSFLAARRMTERALQLAERHGFRMCAANATLQRGWLSFWTGGWEAARRDLEEALAMSRAIGPYWASAYFPLGLGSLCLAEGAEAAAAQHLEECEQLVRSGGYVPVRLFAACVFAERDVLAGRPDVARARLAPLLDPSTPLEEDMTQLLQLMAWALLDQDEVVEASAVAAQAVARARETGRLVLLVDALRVLAMVATRQGCQVEANDALEEGVLLAQRLGYLYGEARLLQVSYELHVHTGQAGMARERLEAAQGLFAQLGAWMDLARVQQALGALSQNDGLEGYETVVSDAQWAQIQALLPPPTRTGRRRADDRRILEAILYQQRLGCAWAALPAAYGDKATAHRRWQEWRAAGLWTRIATIVQAAAAASDA
jgi:hypothetical protein